ncbi:MAG: hypothetical protein R3C05_28835 [Pirellulaceae bacterium]
MEAEQDAAERLLNDLQVAIKHREAETEQLRDEWRHVWRSCPVEVRTPREMLAWLNEFQQLVSCVQSHSQAGQRVDRLQQRVEQAVEQLRHAIRGVGREPTSLDLVGLVHEARSAIEAVRGRKAQHDEWLRQHESFEESLPAAEQKANRDEAAMQRWRNEWREVTTRLKLSDRAGTHEVTSVIDGYHELVGLQKELDGFQKRIDGIDEDVKAFELQVHRLGIPVVGSRTDVSQIVAGWANELKTAQRQQAERDTLLRDIEQEKQRLKELERERIDVACELQHLCKEAKCEDVDQLLDIYKRSEAKQKLLERREDVASQIRQLAGTSSFDEYLADVGRLDSVELDAEIEQLHDRQTQLQDDYAATMKELGQLEEKRSAMNGDARAADLQQEIHEILGRIGQRADQFARLKVAETLLRRAINAYRERNQGPILKIASEYFRRLTLNSFSELRADNNEKGEPILLGVRATNGKTVDLSGMSQGTADQLYLALRLASLKHSFDHSDPIPLVVDDILIQCDLDRSKVAFELLAELSDQTQIIFFTHNQALLDLALESVQPDRLFVQTLQSDRHRESDPASSQVPLFVN